jgi:hypothetical protein
MSAAYSELPEAPPVLLRHVRLGVGGPLGDLRISAGVVAAAGPRVHPMAGDEIVDGTGATVLPGLWDSHVHTVQWALARQRLDLSAASSAQAAVDLAAARPRGTGDEVLIGYGYRDAAWPDTPHKKLLEAAVPGRAVVLVSNDLVGAENVVRAGQAALPLPKSSSVQVTRHARTRGGCRRGDRVFGC